MDKSQSYPEIPGAAEYYAEVIAPSEMIKSTFEVMEMQFFAAYGGCTRGYSSERAIATTATKAEAEAMAKAKMQEKGIGAPFYYSVKEVK